MTQTPHLKRILAPSHMPVSLLEAKLFCRIDNNAEDELIKNLIKAATNMAEEYIRASLITQKWQLDFDNYAPSIVCLSKGPVQSVESVKTISETFAETVVAASSYTINSANDEIEFDAAQMGHIVRVTYVAGFGNADDVPPMIRHGILTHVASMYENRGNSEIPHDVVTLYNAHRAISL